MIQIYVMLMVFTTIVATDEVFNVSITKPSNLTVLITDRVEVEARIQGNTLYIDLTACIYDASSSVYDFNRHPAFSGFPSLLHRCFQVPSLQNLNSTFSFIATSYNPGSFRFKAIVFDQRDPGRVYCQSTVFIDIIPREKMSGDRFRPIPFSYIQNFRKVLLSRKDKYHGDTKNVVGIFFKDLEAHGCNIRLLRFICSSMRQRKDSNLSVEILLAARPEKSSFLITYLSKNCMKIKIHFIPPLVVDVVIRRRSYTRKNWLSTSEYYVDPIDDDFLQIAELLKKFDVLICQNTLGDLQTDALFAVIEKIREDAIIDTVESGNCSSSEEVLGNSQVKNHCKFRDPNLIITLAHYTNVALPAL